MLLDLIKAVIMGVVEGITEFLPISSTGHLIVAGALMNFPAPDSPLKNTFEIFIQLGAVLAVVVYYARDLLQQARTINQASTQRFWLGIIIAFIPAAIIGLLLDDFITEVLFSPTVVAISLIVGGIIFIVVERRRTTETTTTTFTLEGISLRQALAIGIGQTLALIPGVSRSGATIITGLLAGLDRPTATKFSFYLTIPTLGAATVYSLLRQLDLITSDQLVLLIVGTVVSFFVSLIAIGWLLRYVAHNTFTAFGVYRILAGIIILILAALAIL